MNKATICSGNAQHQEGECTHLFNEMAFSQFPEPDYPNIEFIGPPNGVTPIIPETSHNPNHWLAAEGADVPYAFTIGAVTIIGVLYIRGSGGIDTYTSGVIGGVLDCTYDHVNRNRATFKCPGVGVKGYIVLDFQKKHCVAWTETLGTRCCGYRNWGKCEEWYTSNQVILASW